MPENEGNDVNVTPNSGEESSGSLGDYPLHSDPFNFSEDGSGESPLDNIAFNMNDEGELEISGLEVSEERESKEGEEQVETPTEDPSYIPDPFEGDTSRELSTIEKENAELKERLAKVEGRFVDADSQKKQAQLVQERRTKLEAAGFTDEQIDVILEINPVKVEGEEKPEEHKLTPEEIEQNQVELNRQAGEVLQRYNGQEGRPSVQDMKPHVEYAYMKFGEQSTRVPLPILFRVAENSLFLRWIETNYPEQTKQYLTRPDGSLDIKRSFNASENLRKIYYQKFGKPVSSYEHIKIGKKTEGNNNNGGNNLNNNLNNEDVQRLSHEKNENSRNVPGGEIETEEELNERRRPRDARSTVEATLSSFGIE